jgi:1,2-diacylglycerol 3-alpha-glucosyltransferase
MLTELYRVVRREKIEIIHAHNYEGALIGLFAKFMTGKPMIYNAVNLMSDELSTYRFFKPAFTAKWIAAILDWFVPIFPDHIIAVTKELYEWLSNRGIPQARLTMIPCGIKPAMFDHADGDKFRSKYAIGSRPVVMYTGINNAFQRVDYLLRAFSVVLKEEPSALLMVVSPIENEPDLPANQAMARELKIADSVIYVGPHTLSDLPNYIATATVTVVPRPECPGHPIKLLNYMISGKPIVCFAGGAKGITHMHDALLVRDHDWQEMGEAILKLLRDPELAIRLGSNARETAINNFDWEILSKKVEAIYQSLMNRDRRSGKQTNKPMSTPPDWKENLHGLARRSIALYRVIRSERANTIHARNYEGVLIGTLAKFITRKPHVYNAVNLMSDEFPTYGLNPVFLANGLQPFSRTTFRAARPWSRWQIGNQRDKDGPG